MNNTQKDETMSKYNQQITKVIFVDLRDTPIGRKFGFWETTTNTFVSVCGSYAWNTYAEFEEYCEVCNRVAKHKQDYNYKYLCPEWVYVNQCKVGSKMNNKYLFNGENWIVTPGEIKITPLHGTKPIHPALSKKLYDQNRAKYHDKVLTPLYNAIKEKVTTINKYTIVELTHNNKHYHGLASRADCDKDNVVTGIAVAYHRAFEKMMQHPQTNVADESPIKKSAVDVAVDFFKKHQESKAHFRKCLLGAFGVTDNEVGIKENTHKHNLKAHLKSIAKERSEFP